MMNLQCRTRGSDDPWHPWARLENVDDTLLRNYQKLLPRSEWRWISDAELERERIPFLRREASGPLVLLAIIAVIALIGIAGILVRAAQ